MNIRCSFCQLPYAIGRNETLAALKMMQDENLHHYDAHCPRCRRATPISRERLEMGFPNWQEALKELEAMEAQAAPPAPQPVAKAETIAAPPALKESSSPKRKRHPAKTADKTESKPPAKTTSPAKAKPVTPKKTSAKKSK